MAGLAEIQATTWEHREKKPSDLVLDNNPLTYMLKQKGRVKIVNGGRVIWEPARIAQNQYVQRIDASEEIVLGRNDVISQFEYSPRILLVPVTMNVLEEAQNMGDGKFLDLLDERNEVADASMMNALEEDIQGDGTGYGGKAFAGIKSYIVTSTSTGSYGGLSRVSYSSIRNSAVDAPTTFTGATDSSNIESRLRYTKNLVLKNGGPELCLAGQTYYNAACDAMSAKQRFTQNKDLLEANFDNVVIEGMTMVLAAGKQFSGLARIAADRAYLIRLENFALRMYKGFNFQPLEKRTSFNQLVDVSINLGIGQFTCNGASLSAVMYDS
jgi:hypothetical protein